MLHNQSGKLDWKAEAGFSTTGISGRTYNYSRSMIFSRYSNRYVTNWTSHVCNASVRKFTYLSLDNLGVCFNCPPYLEKLNLDLYVLHQTGAILSIFIRQFLRLLWSNFKISRRISILLVSHLSVLGDLGFLLKVLWVFSIEIVAKCFECLRFASSPLNPSRRVFTAKAEVLIGWRPF